MFERLPFDEIHDEKLFAIILKRIDHTRQIDVIEFGIARFFKHGKTKDTTPFGTVGYAAPEQFGTGQTDARSDVYSLGVTLHTLLTKYDPAQSPFNLPPARTLNPQVSPPTEAVIARATLSAPGQRFQSAREMKQALHPVIDHQPMPFIFRGGEQARNITELVRVCENKPSDAVWHLESGHFEPWLVSIGQPALAQAATMARQATGGATERLKQFIALTGVPSTLTGAQNAGAQPRYSREFVFDASRAGGLRRFFGLGIDLAILFVLMSFVFGLLGRATVAQANVALIFSGLAMYLYFVLAWIIAGQTIGQMLAGIRVLRTDGTLAGFWVATGRWIVMAITVALCWGLVPYLILAYLWNRFRKPPHDRLTHTEAVRTRFMAKQYPGYDLAMSGHQYFGVVLSAVLCSFLLPLGAAGIAGLSAAAMAAAPTPAPTAAPPTATPKPDAWVQFFVDLKSGPANGFDTVGTLTHASTLKIIGRDSTTGSDWILVRDESNRQGWVRASQVNLNVALSGFPYTQGPATPTPLPPTRIPTVTRTPTPKSCPPNPVLVQINNSLDASMDLTLNGPNTAAIVSIPRNDSARLCLTPGTYSYTSRVTGYYDKTGTKDFAQESDTICIHWDWTPLSALGLGGTCSSDASQYTVP